MRYRPDIHPLSMVIKSFLGRLEFFSGKLRYAEGELLVVNYHSTPDKFLFNFESQVKFLKKHFTIIDPAQLGNYFLGKTFRSGKSLLLFTFDDGLKNNLGAASILEKHGIKAYFFIVPAFIDAAVTSQKNYYVNYIRPVINPKIDREPKDFESMSWEEVKLLIGKGHAVGSHSYTHTLIAEQSGQSNSAKEIVESKNCIEKNVGVTINAFCSINNSLTSVGSKEKKMIAQEYTFHFTTLPGLNSENKDPLFIKRRNIEAFWLKGAVCYALGKMDLSRWKSRIDAYNAL
jgi:peptidoglycan/xylan/chitin deacetylase (PgdA/CDA1 family)